MFLGRLLTIDEPANERDFSDLDEDENEYCFPGQRQNPAYNVLLRFFQHDFLLKNVHGIDYGISPEVSRVALLRKDR